MTPPQNDTQQSTMPMLGGGLMMRTLQEGSTHCGKLRNHLFTAELASAVANLVHMLCVCHVAGA